MDIRAGGLCSYLGSFCESVAIKVDTLDGAVSQTRRIQRMCNNASANCVSDGGHFAQHRTHVELRQVGKITMMRQSTTQSAIACYVTTRDR